MGWLRDLMLRSEPPVASLHDLARKALADPDWPQKSAIRERSLATLLSKLDRGQELDWLRDRPEETGVLAKTLGRSASEITQLLGDTPVRRDRRVFRLHDVRYARDLDLVREDLAPGFPREVQHPVHWASTLVWLVPSGTGRSLLGAWLEARGLAQVCRLAGPDDPIPPYGALFVDLPEGHLLSQPQLERLKRHQRPVCIATARVSQLADDLRGSQVIELPHPS